MKRIIKRQLVLLICILIILGLALSGCGSSTPKEPEEESQQEETDAEEETDVVDENSDDTEETEEDAEETAEEAAAEDTTPDQEPFDVETANKRRSRYVEILRNLRDNLILPNGDQLFYEGEMFGRIEDNEFGVVDIDGDGAEELIVRFTTAPMVGMFERVFGYDEENDIAIEELSSFPSIEYSAGGIAKAFISHNQGTAGRFWPYTLCKYNKETKVYDSVAFINAWDGSLFAENYDGEPFPAEEDKDGDQLIYFITTDPYEDTGDREYIDIDELNAWLSEQTGDGESIDYDRFKLTDYNIESYAAGSSYTLSYDENYSTITTGNLELILPKDFLDNVEMEEFPEGISFYHKGNKDFGEEYLGYEGMGWLGTVSCYHDSSYYDMPSYSIIDSNFDETYLMIYPTDVRFVLPAYLEDAQANGYDGTEAELEALGEEYSNLFNMLKGAYGEIMN